nr:hypothetical protein [Tanacetum cinerariifolium]
MRPSPSIESSTSDLQNSNSSVFEHGESSSSIMSKPMIKFVKAADSPTIIKTNKVETDRNSSVKYAEITPVAVNRTNMNVAQPKRTSFAKTAHSNVRRHFQRKSAVRTQSRVLRVSTVTRKFPIVDSKFFTADLGIKGTKGKAIKASACWIWRPKQNTTEKGPNCNGVSVTFKKYQYIDTQGRLKSDIHSVLEHSQKVDVNREGLDKDKFDRLKYATISESSLKRHLKLNDAEGISSLPDAEAQQSLHHDPSSPSHPTATTESIPTEILIETPTLSLQRQQTQMATKIKDQDLEISGLKARIKILEDKDRGSAESSGDNALIKGRSIKIGEEVGVERSTKLGSNDTEEMVNVLTSMDAVNILTSEVTTVSVPSIAEVSTVGVPTVSGLVPTVSAIFTTASVVTPYSRRPRGISAKDKGKEKVVESKEPKKKKLQEQIDAQVAREIEEEIAREDQRMNEQLTRDAEIARIHAKEELKMLIDGLDRSNELIAKHLHQYERFAADLSVGEKIELINELVKCQDHHAKILKYQAQQSKPLSKKKQREFYMSVLRSHAGWKTKHFRGMILKEIREKFIPIWKQIEDFFPMSSTEEAQRVKRKGLRLDQGSSKRMKTSEDEIHSEGKKDYWKIIRLGGHTTVYQFFVDMLKQLDREDLHQLWALVKETLSIRHATKDKEKELWVKLKRLFEPDFKDQLWTHNQNFMNDPLEWKLYDTCGVHYVFTKDQEIFMLVEKDYPLRKGLAIVMICNKLQVENYLQMANDLIMKIHNIANSPR